MGSVAPQPDAPKFLLTGIYGLRDVVLALPRLSALRAQNPDANITIVAPAGARDLLLRLKLVDHVRVLDDRSVMSVLFWGWWQRLRGSFDRVIDGAKLEHNYENGLLFVYLRKG